jgi:retron-type reverse transcriptase
LATLCYQFQETGNPGAIRDLLPQLFSLPDINQDSSLLQIIPTSDINFATIGLCIGISPLLLVRMILNPSRFCREFTIPKSDGTERKIETPRVFLKVVQWFLLDKVISYFPTSAAVHSFLPKRSVVTNAKIHQGRRFVAKIDIENFFGSITFEHLRYLFSKHGYASNDTNMILGFCMKENRLPQGAPTSPALSNALLIEFDEEMMSSCSHSSSFYTRYADDITISGDDRQKLSELIKLAEERLKDRYGFKLNHNKTRIIPKSQQQKVAGVVVNTLAAPPRKRIRQIRAAFHNASLSPHDYKERTEQLFGYIGYLLQFPEFRKSVILSEYQQILALVRSSQP